MVLLLSSLLVRMTQALPIFTLFYDGACPLCEAEIIFLSRRNQQKLLVFVDIHSTQFNSSELGISCEQALASMYGQFADGRLVQGVSVFAEAYRRANLPALAWIFSRPRLQPGLRMAYRFFAKHRHRIAKLFGPFARKLVG